MRASRQQQLDFAPHTRGGKRAGAGRPVRTKKPPPQHRVRKAHDAKVPVHVTLRVRGDVPRLRRWRVLAQLRAALRRAAGRTDFRVVHASLQSTHLHLIVEADSGEALARGMQGFATSFAMRINALHGRTGKVFASRYAAKPITSPTQMNRTLAYVLKNYRRHGEHRERPTWQLDPFSSAIAFDGWSIAFGPAPPDYEPLPVCRPETWLARDGWRRGGGPIDPRSVPGPVGA